MDTMSTVCELKKHLVSSGCSNSHIKKHCCFSKVCKNSTYAVRYIPPSSSIKHPASLMLKRMIKLRIEKRGNRKQKKRKNRDDRIRVDG